MYSREFTGGSIVDWGISCGDVGAFEWLGGEDEDGSWVRILEVGYMGGGGPGQLGGSCTGILHMRLCKAAGGDGKGHPGAAATHG